MSIRLPDPDLGTESAIMRIRIRMGVKNRPERKLFYTKFARKILDFVFVFTFSDFQSINFELVWQIFIIGSDPNPLCWSGSRTSHIMRIRIQITGLDKNTRIMDPNPRADLLLDISDIGQKFWEVLFVAGLPEPPFLKFSAPAPASDEFRLRRRPVPLPVPLPLLLWSRTKKNGSGCTAKKGGSGNPGL